jgi:acyl carrier protein
MSSAEPIAQRVRAIIAEVLSVEEREATPSARFFRDLGGESIDILDLSFQLERQLGAKVEFGQLFAGDTIRTGQRGVVMPESLNWLADKYPFLPVQELRPNPTADSLKDLLTVDAITRFVELALSGSPARR